MRRIVISLLVFAVVMLVLGVSAIATFLGLTQKRVPIGVVASLLTPHTPHWDYHHSVRQSQNLDPDTLLEVHTAFFASDSVRALAEAEGFTVRISASRDHLMVLVPQPRYAPSQAALLGDKVAYIGLAAPIVGSTQNPHIPFFGNVDVRFMLTQEQLDEFKRDGISPERLQRLRDEAARDGWRPLTMGQNTCTTVRTIPW